MGKAWGRLAVAVFFSLSCAGLTKGQLKGIDTFSKAASGYAKVPDAALQAWFDLHRAAAVLKVSTSAVTSQTDAGQALAALKSSLAHQQQMKAAAGKLVAALSFVDEYAAALSALTTDDGDALDKDAQAIGRSLDGAVAQLAKAGGSAPSPTAAFASFAGIARAIAGVAVSQRRAEYVKQFTTAAAPVIRTVAKDVKEMMENLVELRIRPDEQEIDRAFAEHFTPPPEPAGGARPARPSSKISAGDVGLFAAAMQQAAAVRVLAQTAGAASDALVGAHDALVKALAQPDSIGDLFDRAKELGRQVQAGRAVDTALRPVPAAAGGT